LVKEIQAGQQSSHSSKNNYEKNSQHPLQKKEPHSM
jgi:hypothetical protein